MKTLNRREFAQNLASLAAFAAVPAGELLLIGCGGVEAALVVAAQIAATAAGLVRPLNPRTADLLNTVSTDLKLVDTLYQQYQAGDHGKFAEIQATLATITNNLADILAAAHIFNPALTLAIKTAIAIANTAISLIISHLPAQHKAQAHAQRLALPPLPIIDGAKSAKDLKKAWNDAVSANYPSAVVK